MAGHIIPYAPLTDHQATVWMSCMILNDCNYIYVICTM